jgi:DDE superfamily endonuclease
MLITRGSYIIERWLAPDLPSDTLYATSESGYTNDALALEYIQYFDRLTAPRSRGARRLLLFDGYGSYLTVEVIRYCDNHGIILMALLSHTSHLLQPLDIGCFQLYKHIYKEEIERLIRRGEYTFDRQEFFFCLANVRNRALTASTIQSAWRKAGLAPPYSRETIDPVIHALDRANNRARGGARSEALVLGEALE